MSLYFAPHATDFYKTGHIRQYPVGTQVVYANFTPRADKLAKLLPDFDHKVVNFGIRAVVKWLLVDTWDEGFFRRPKAEVLSKYKRRMDRALGPDAVSIDHIAALHDLGYLPVRIKALPEGLRVDVRVPLFTIQNTLTDFYWVTNYLETQLSAECWKMITSATTAYEYRRLLDRYAEETGTDKDFVQWQGHDFSMRGMSGIWDATQSGAAHLLSFTGTDTVTALDFLEDYYQGADESILGGSVPATEHSVMCMGGSIDELGTYKRLITETYPKGIVSIVSDTWDFWQVMTKFTRELYPEIMSREGKVVFRPDSGDPVKIITGYEVDSLEDAWTGSEAVRKEDGTYWTIQPTNENRAGWTFDRQLSEPEVFGAVDCLWDVFGGTITATGHKLLDSHVGLIYGDSITIERAQAILARLKAQGYASGNIVFGVGSYTYQFVTRDTFGTAIKATWGVVNGEKRELFKDPITDNGTKRSARGLLRIEFEDGHFVLHDRQTRVQEHGGLLETVFENSVLYNKQSLTEIRNLLLEHGGKPAPRRSCALTEAESREFKELGVLA